MHEEFIVKAIILWNRYLTIVCMHRDSTSIYFAIHIVLQWYNLSFHIVAYEVFNHKANYGQVHHSFQFQLRHVHTMVRVALFVTLTTSLHRLWDLMLHTLFTGGPKLDAEGVLKCHAC